MRHDTEIYLRFPTNSGMKNIRENNIMMERT